MLFWTDSKFRGPFIFQLEDGKVDMAIGDFLIMRETYDVVDYSNFVSVSEIMFSVCLPPRVKGTFNMLRPFRYGLVMEFFSLTGDEGQFRPHC